MFFWPVKILILGFSAGKIVYWPGEWRDLSSTRVFTCLGFSSGIQTSHNQFTLRASVQHNIFNRKSEVKKLDLCPDSSSSRKPYTRWISAHTFSSRYVILRLKIQLIFLLCSSSRFHILKLTLVISNVADTLNRLKSSTSHPYKENMTTYFLRQRNSECTIDKRPCFFNFSTEFVFFGRCAKKLVNTTTYVEPSKSVVDWRKSRNYRIINVTKFTIKLIG